MMVWCWRRQGWLTIFDCDQNDDILFDDADDDKDDNSNSGYDADDDKDYDIINKNNNNCYLYWRRLKLADVVDDDGSRFGSLGRCMPVASFATHHSPDLVRGLLTFANGKPLGEKGVHVCAIACVCLRVCAFLRTRVA